MLNKVDPSARNVPAYSVPPVVRAIKLLRYIADGNSVANQSQAARAIGINRTTMLRLIRTLEAEGFIDRVPGTDNYTLGTGIIELAAHKIFSLDVAQVASPILERVADELRVSCHLGILEGREILYVLRAAPNAHLVSNVQVGTRLPAHATTIGRAILAHLPPGDVAAMYGGVPMKAATPRTPTTPEALARNLDEVRAAGFADSRSSFEQGIDSIAAAVFDHTGKVVAAINATGPERAFGGAAGRRESITATVREAAGEISKRLGFVAGERARTARR